jgi:hypothetical protein
VTADATTIGDMNWSYQPAGVRFRSESIASVSKGSPVCECLKRTSASALEEYSIGSAANGVVLARSTDYNTPSGFVEAYGAYKLKYALETPVTYQLSQTEFARALTALGILTTEVSFGSAGTVYGGTLDVTNGVLTVTMAEVDLGTLNWTYYSANTIFCAHLPSNPKSRGDVICTAYRRHNTDGERIANVDNVVGLGYTGFYINRVYVKDTKYTNESAFSTAMQGVQLVYELATPITYQLTPTEVQMLLGTNNIWADTGDILEGKYYGKRSSATRAMLNTLRDAGEITEITPEEPEELEEPEESDER